MASAEAGCFFCSSLKGTSDYEDLIDEETKHSYVVIKTATDPYGPFYIVLEIWYNAPDDSGRGKGF
jgi:hypothetical protein